MNISRICAYVSQAPEGSSFYFKKHTSAVSIHTVDKIEEVKKTILNVISQNLSRFLTLPTSFSKKIEQLIASDMPKEEIYPPLCYLQDVFGKARVDRVCEEVDAINFHTTTISQQQLGEILPRLLLLLQEDYEELFQEIKGHSSPRNSIIEALPSLREQFKECATFHDCREEHFHLLEEYLLPFKKRSRDPFVNGHAVKYPSMEMMVSSNAAMRHLTYSVEHLRKHSPRVRDWEVFVAKRLGMFSLPKGLVIRHPKGQLTLRETIEQHGVLKMFFVPLGHYSTTLAPYVLYRGTKISPAEMGTVVANLKDDFARDIGSFGARKTYSSTRKILKQLGKNTQVNLLGFSLGGALAQRDAALFPKRVRKIVTVASPGIDRKTCALFSKIVKREKLQHKTTHNIDYGDLIPLSGESLLGWDPTTKSLVENCKIRVRCYHHLRDITRRDVVRTFEEQTPRIFFSNFVETLSAHSSTPSLSSNRPYNVCEFTSEQDGEVLQKFFKRNTMNLAAYVERARRLVGSLLHSFDFHQFLAGRVHRMLGYDS